MSNFTFRPTLLFNLTLKLSLLNLHSYCIKVTLKPLNNMIPRKDEKQCPLAAIPS